MGILTVEIAGLKVVAKKVIINGCPHDSHINVDGFANFVWVHNKSTGISYGHHTGGIATGLLQNYFESFQNLSKIVWGIIRDGLGFFPFVKYVNGELHYDTEADFKTIEEMQARRRKIVMTRLWGVQVPLALVKNMKLITETRENLAELGDEMSNFLPPILSDHPWMLKYGVEAIKALSRSYITEIEYISIYELLGLDDIIDGKIWIIHGDQLFPENFASLARSGWLFSTPEHTIQIHINTFEIRKIDKEKMEFISDSMIEKYKLYDRTEFKNLNGKQITPFQARIFKYLINVNGY